MSMTKGVVVYSAPKNHWAQRTFSWIMILVAWIAAGGVVYSVVMGGVDISDRMSPIVFWLMLPIVLAALIYIPFLGRMAILTSEFKIYENGITTPMYSLIPGKEGRFIPFTRIRAFEMSGKDHSRLTAHLSITEAVHFSHRWKQVIDVIEKELRSKGVVEMPTHCTTCEHRLFRYTRECPECGSPIFE